MFVLAITEELFATRQPHFRMGYENMLPWLIARVDNEKSLVPQNVEKNDIANTVQLSEVHLQTLSIPIDALSFNIISYHIQPAKTPPFNKPTNHSLVPVMCRRRVQLQQLRKRLWHHLGCADFLPTDQLWESAPGLADSLHTKCAKFMTKNPFFICAMVKSRVFLGMVIQPLMTGILIMGI